MHSRTEVREGPHVKGEAIIDFNDKILGERERAMRPLSEQKRTG